MTDETRTEVVKVLRTAGANSRFIALVTEDPVVGRIAREARDHAAEIMFGPEFQSPKFYARTCQYAADLVERGSWP